LGVVVVCVCAHNVNWILRGYPEVTLRVGPVFEELKQRTGGAGIRPAPDLLDN